MAEYWRVSPRIWQEPWSDEARLLAFYLLTCEHREMEGLYRLPKEYICADLGWTPRHLAPRFEELLRSGFIDYDVEAKVVFIPSALKHQRPDNPNQVKHALAKIENLPRTPLLAKFLLCAERYAPALAEGLRERFAERLGQPPTPAPATTPALAPAPAPATTPSLVASQSEELVLAEGGAEADTDFTEEFERFWNSYPRHVEKRRAYRAWGARLALGASVEEMTAAARHYCDACYGKDPRFVKLAATFLGPDSPFSDWCRGVPAGFGTSDLNARQIGQMATELEEAGL